MEMEIKEQLAHFEERLHNNEKEIGDLDERLKINERMVMEMDKSLSISMKQIETIAENLKQTSVNFKEAVMRSNADNAKDTEILKEKYKELNAKIEKLNEKLEKETTGKDAESWRSSKKQIWSWILNFILLVIAAALGISRFL